MRAVWCGFALGVVWLQQQAVLPGWPIMLGLCAGVCSLVAVARQCFLRGGVGSARAGWLAVLLASMCAGFGYAAWRAQTRLAFELPHAWEGRDIGVSGWVKGLPTQSADGTRFLLAVESVESVDAPIERFPRTLQLSWVADDAPPTALDPGTRWRLTVRLKRAHGNANWGVRDAEAALLARDIRATGYVSQPSQAVRLAGRARGVGVIVDGWRWTIRKRIAAVLADAPHMGIVVALAIGAQDTVSAADWLLMRRTGTSHLVAISGLHIGFVAGLAGWLAGAAWRRSFLTGLGLPLRVPAQKVAMAGGALFAAFHALLAGFNVPAQRTLWMTSIVALAGLGGRRMAPSVVLAWALGLVLLVDPWAAVSAGFWLSFCAVGAILFAMSGTAHIVTNRTAGSAPEDERERGMAVALRLRIDALIRRLRSGARVQFAVTVALAPLTIGFFSQLPLIGPVANAFAIPWVSALVTPAVIAGVALPAPLDAFAFRLAHILLDGLVIGLRLLSGPAWTVWQLPQPGAWAMASAALGVAWCLAPSGWPLRWAAPLTWLPLLAPASAAPADGAFRLTALDIGQGSSIVVETAHHTLLFDAGPGPESTHAGERIVVPYLQAAGIGTLDTLVVSHADSDHSGGAPAVLDGIEVKQLLAGLPPNHALWRAASGKGAQTVRCAAGQHWQWDGVDFTILWPDAGPLQGKPNAHCCVLRVSTSGDSHVQTHRSGRQPVAAVLAADIEAPVERTLRARDPAALRAQILLVPHHGSKTSSTEPFLDSIEPSISIFQVGYRNRFHHPYPGVYERYRARGIALSRSDADGAARIDADAASLSIERYRQTHRRYWMDPPDP